MRFRKLRIAFSATCLIACVLLIVLWVRSYWWADEIIGETRTSFPSIMSLRGAVGIMAYKRIGEEHAANADCKWHATRLNADNYIKERGAFAIIFKPLKFVQRRGIGSVIGIVLPYWLLVLVAVIPPAIHVRHSVRRFSLRTLLIATTLVAVVLGLIVRAAK